MNNGKRLAQLMNDHKTSKNKTTSTFSAATNEKKGVFKYYGETFPEMWFSTTLEFAEMDTQISDCHGYGRDLIHGASLWTQERQGSTILAASAELRKKIIEGSRLGRLDGRIVSDRFAKGSRNAGVLYKWNPRGGTSPMNVGNGGDNDAVSPRPSLNRIAASVDLASDPDLNCQVPLDCSSPDDK